MADESDKAEPSAPTCLSNPNFAVICSFLDKFSVSAGLTVLPFTQLQEMLENQDQVSQVLIDLHIKLLRRARKSFAVDKWERALTKFAHSYSQQDGWELERFGYKKASLGVKLQLLKTLLETQFDMNVRFKNEVNKLTSEELRIQPLGKDKEGLTYWCQFDPACNVRVYREDADEETWDVVAQDRKGLVSLIDTLSSGEGQKELDLILNEEGLIENDKPVTDTGQEESGKVDVVSNGKVDGISNGKIDDEKVEEEEEDDEDDAEEEDEEEEDGDQEDVGEEEEEDERMSVDSEPKPPNSAPVEVEEKLEESLKEEVKNVTAPKEHEAGSAPSKEIKEDTSAIKQDKPNAPLEEVKEDISPKAHDKPSAPREDVREAVAPKEHGKTNAPPKEDGKDIKEKVREEKPKPPVSDDNRGAIDFTTREKKPDQPEPIPPKPVDRNPSQNITNGVSIRKETENNGSIDLSIKVPTPSKPVGHRPGSKLEEIFKKKIDRPTFSYGNDQSSILNQMSARFNNVDHEVEDLSMVSAKKPKLDLRGKEEGSANRSAAKAEPIVGEAIEEKVMLIKGEGAGAECNAGNPIAERDSGGDAPLEVVAIFNSSYEESAREVVRECIKHESALDDNERCRGGVLFEQNLNKNPSSMFTDAELNILNHIRILNSSSIPSNDSENITPIPSKPKDFVFEVSEVIEEDVMYFSGCGAGHSCDTGNPGKVTTEAPSTSSEKPEKVTKKLWSIDAICKISDKSKTDAKEEVTTNGPAKSNCVKDEEVSDGLDAKPKEKSSTKSNKSGKDDDENKKEIVTENGEKCEEIKEEIKSEEVSVKKEDPELKSEVKDQANGVKVKSESDPGIGKLKDEPSDEVGDKNTSKQKDDAKPKLSEKNGTAKSVDKKHKNEVKGKPQDKKEVNKSDEAETVDEKLEKNNLDTKEKCAEKKTKESKTKPDVSDKKDEDTSKEGEDSEKEISKEESADAAGDKPKGRKSRTNSLNVADEVPPKLRKTDDEEPPKEPQTRRSSRRSTRASSINETAVKKDTSEPALAKPLTLATFSLDITDDYKPVVKLTKADLVLESKVVKRKRQDGAAVKSEEECTEGEDSKVEQEADDDIGGKKPRLKGKVKRTGGRSRKRGRGGFRGSARKTNPSTTADESKEENENEDTAAGSESEVKTEEAPTVDEVKDNEESKAASDDDIPLAKRGKVPPKDEKNTPTLDKTEDSGKKEKKRTKRSTMLGLTERDLQSVKDDENADSGGRMRASRRIAMQKIKEEAERRAVEDVIKDIDKAGRKKKDKKMGKIDPDGDGSPKKDKLKIKSGKKKRRRKSDSEEEEEEKEEPLDDKKEGKRRKKKKERFKYNIHKPWVSSSGSSDENPEEEEEDHLEFMGMEDDDDVGKVVSDHEFSCDEDLKDLEKGEGEEQPVRRARTAIRKEKGESKEEEKEGDDLEDYKCQKCNKDDHPEWILLCDTCDQGYHASCLRPPLMLIPEGDWHCPTCQHNILVKKLKDVLRTFEKNSKRRENEELRRKRLEYVGISLANVLSDNTGNKVKKPKKPVRGENESSSEDDGSNSDESDSDSSEDSEEEPIYQLRQRRSAVQNYRFNDYDQLIDNAIQDEVVPAEFAVIPSTETGGNVEGEQAVPTENGEVNAAGQEGQQHEEEEGDVSKGWRPPVVPRRQAVQFGGRKKPKKLNNLEVDSDDQNDSDEDFKGSASEDEEEEFSEGSDESADWKRSSRQPLRRSGRARQSRVDRDFVNDDSDESYRGSKKKKKKKQEWDESDSSSDSDRSWGRRKKKATPRSSYSKAKGRSKKKKKEKTYDSDSDAPKKKPKPKKSRVRYRLSEEEDDGPLIRTRGKKMNYAEIHGSDTEEEERINRIKGRKTLSDMEAEDEEFVLDQEEEEKFMGGQSLVKKAPRRISSSSDGEGDKDDADNKAKDDDSQPLPESTKPLESVEDEDVVEIKNPSREKIQSISAPANSNPLPRVSQPLPASRPRPPPTIFRGPQRIESDEDEIEEDEDEEEDFFEDGDVEGEDEGLEEEEGESDEEKDPLRPIPPPVPSLKLRVPSQEPSQHLAVTVTKDPQSRLKAALSSVETKPKESEALIRLREKLAGNNPSKSAISVTVTSVPTPPIVPKIEPGTEEKEKPATPIINSIRVVSPQKLMAHPPEPLKPPPDSVIRGMLGPHGGPPHPGSLPPGYFNRAQIPGRLIPAGMDPLRFMQRSSLHPPHHLHQQRRFPGRYLYGGGVGPGYHAGYFPNAPVPFPPQDIRPVPSGDFRDNPIPSDGEPGYPPNANQPGNPDGPGEFGGLVSYFSSQREDDGELDT